MFGEIWPKIRFGRTCFRLLLLQGVIVAVCDALYEKSITAVRFDNDNPQMASFINRRTALTSYPHPKRSVKDIRSITIDLLLVDRAAPLPKLMPIEPFRLIILYPWLLLIILYSSYDGLGYVVPVPIIDNSIDVCSNQHPYRYPIIEFDLTNGAYVSWQEASMIRDSNGNNFTTSLYVHFLNILGGLLVCTGHTGQPLPVGIVRRTYKKFPHLFQIEQIGIEHPTLKWLDLDTPGQLNDYTRFATYTKSDQCDQEDAIRTALQTGVPTAFNTDVQYSTFISDRLAVSIYEYLLLYELTHITFFFNLMYPDGKVTVMKASDLGLYSYANRYDILVIVLPKSVRAADINIKYALYREPQTLAESKVYNFYTAPIIDINDEEEIITVDHYQYDHFNPPKVHGLTFNRNAKVYQWNIGTPAVGKLRDGQVTIAGIIKKISQDGLLRLVGIPRATNRLDKITVDWLIKGLEMDTSGSSSISHHAKKLLDKFQECHSQEQMTCRFSKTTYERGRLFLEKLLENSWEGTHLHKNLKDLVAVLQADPITFKKEYRLRKEEIDSTIHCTKSVNIFFLF